MEVRGIVSENVAIGVVRQKLRELHEALRMIEDAAWEGETTSRKRRESSIAESIVVALQEPRLNFINVVRCKAKLFSYSDSDPGALHVCGLEAIWECVGSIVDGTKPDLESIAEAAALVVEGDISLSTLVW